MLIFALSAAGEVAGVASVIVGVIVAIVALTSAAAKFQSLRPVRWVLERLIMHPAGEALDRRIDERVLTALDERLLPLSEMVVDIHHEMHPNSNKSMRDSVDRIEGTAIYLSGQVERLKEDSADTRDRVSRIEGRLDAWD